MLNISLNTTDKINAILSKIQENINIDVSSYSYTAQIVSSLVNAFPELFDSINDIINECTIENKTGDELNSFLSFFNISRLTNSAFAYKTFVFKYEGNGYVYLPKGSKIEYEDKVFEIVKDYTIGKSKNMFKVLCIETPFTLNTEYFLFGTLKLFTEGINISNSESDMITHFKDNFYFYGIEQNDSSEENDIEFLNRSKSILQEYGMSNKSKIVNTIKNIQGVYDCIYIEKTNYTDIYIIPNEYDNIDAIYEAAEEIVKYYKSNRIVLKKPFVVSFNILGVLTQVPDSVKTNIEEAVKIYLKNISTNEYMISSDELIKIIFDICYSVDKTYNFMENDLKVKYDIFGPKNYKSPICSNELSKNRTKYFDNKCIFVLNSLK